MDANAVIFQLLDAREQANNAYLAGQIDAPEWTEQLKEIDKKLHVVGLALTNRPWTGSGGTF
jgi:hypothetical protein